MPKPYTPKYPAWSGLPAAQKAGKAATPPRGSWWTAFARGPRRDAEFQAKAEALVPKQSDDGVQLDIWVHE